MKCPVCGTENPDVAVACQTCGQRFGPGQVAQVVPHAHPLAQPEQKKSGKLALMVAVIVIVIVALIGVAVAYGLSQVSNLEITDADAYIYPDGEMRFTVTVENTGDDRESGTLVCYAECSDLPGEYTKETAITVEAGQDRTFSVYLYVPVSWYAYEVYWKCWID